MDFFEAYTKAQQRENKKKGKQKRQAPTKRDIRNYLLIRIGAQWLKSFPVCNKIDPYNSKELAGLARVFALLTKNPEHQWINRLIEEALNTNIQDRE